MKCSECGNLRKQLRTAEKERDEVVRIGDVAISKADLAGAERDEAILRCEELRRMAAQHGRESNEARREAAKWKEEHENLLNMYHHAISDLHNLRRLRADSQPALQNSQVAEPFRSIINTVADPLPAERDCTGCGRTMSIREWNEQRLCDACARSF